MKKLSHCFRHLTHFRINPAWMRCVNFASVIKTVWKFFVFYVTMYNERSDK